MAVPYEENIRGSDLSGSSGDTDRTYELANASGNNVGMQVYINGTFAHPAGADYTFVSATNTITFVNAILDTAYISIYYTTGSLSVTGALYCTASDIQRGLGKDIAFSTTSNPTLDEVEDYIEEAQGEINKFTRRSWKQETVTNEFYDIPPNTEYVYALGVPIYMKRRFIKDFDTDAGDKIEVWNGSDYDDWVATKTEGRENDYWLDNIQGILYLRVYYRWIRMKAVRLTYRYGETTVPPDIRKAAMLLTVIRILSTDDRSVMLNETGDPTRQNYTERINKMQAEVDRIISNNAEYFTT